MSTSAYPSQSLQSTPQTKKLWNSKIPGHFGILWNENRTESYSPDICVNFLSTTIIPWSVVLKGVVQNGSVIACYGFTVGKSFSYYAELGPPVVILVRNPSFA
jgi:hypothetical protein